MSTSPTSRSTSAASSASTGSTISTSPAQASTTSFITPSFSSFTRDSEPTPPVPPSPPPNPNNNIASSASLYLYTFLATLVLLLGVSSAIVIRSLLLRRRHRRLVEEAIRNGTWIPPSSTSRVRVDISKKPKLFEAWISRPGNSLLTNSSTSGGHSGNSLGKGVMRTIDIDSDEHLEWDSIKPFSVSYTCPPPSLPTSTIEPNEAATSPIPNTRQTRSLLHFRFASSIPRISFRRRPTLPSPAPPLPLTQQPSSADQRPSTSHLDEKLPEFSEPQTSEPTKVQVAVLIALPAPPPLPSSVGPSSTILNDEEELPLLEVGVAEVPVSGESGKAGEALFGGKKSMASDQSGSDQEGRVTSRDIGSMI